MNVFEIYIHEFELDGEKYRLKPAPGEYIPAVYSLTSKASEEDAVASFTKEDYDALRVLAVQTFIASYPSEDVKKVEQFVSQNLLRLIDPVIKVNLATPKIKQ